MIKNPFFRKKIFPDSSVKIPITNRSSEMSNLLNNLKRSMIRMLEKMKAYYSAAVPSAFSWQASYFVIHQSNLSVGNSESNFVKMRACLTNPVNWKSLKIIQSNQI